MLGTLIVCSRPFPELFCPGLCVISEAGISLLSAGLSPNQEQQPMNAVICPGGGAALGEERVTPEFLAGASRGMLVSLLQEADAGRRGPKSLQFHLFM